MMPSSIDIERRLVPRWRGVKATLVLRELASAGTSNGHKSPKDDYLAKKLEAWEVSPSLVTAGELAEASIIAGAEAVAKPAADFLLDSTAPSQLQTVGRLLLARASTASDAREFWLPEGGKHVWRNRTRLNGRNPLAWTELSLFEAIEGRGAEAERAMLVALQLSPDNRHVLRAAARLFLHLGDPHRAHAILLKSPRTKTDPWLAAAEIAMASVAGEAVQTFRQGRHMVGDDNFSDWDVTELAGALGTEELATGRRKKARDLFRKSLRQPTGNSLAQAEWAAQSMSDDTLRFPEMDTISEPDEAIALHYYDSDEYQKVVEACIKWSLTEPYSIRPYEMASSVLAEEGCHADLLSHAEKGLKIRPHAPWLLNNAAYALANLDRFNEAEALLRRIDSKEVDAANAALATRGLIELRKGNTVGGFNLYVEAIRSFRSTGKRSLASAAVAYFAVAAVDLKLEAAEQIVAIAKENNKKVLQPTTTKLLARVEATITDRNSSQIAEDIARKGVASEFIDLSKIPEIN